MIATTFALSAIMLTIGCSSSDDNPAGAANANADPISIVTVKGEQHVLTGNHVTACYGSDDGRIDTLTVTNTTWINSSAIYVGDATCSGAPTSSGSATASIVKGVDKLISGWRNQGDIAPQRADAIGSLSENENVTTFTLTITEIDDPDNIFAGNVSVGYEATAFYVFDDTADGDTYIMYRDKDGDFASASDPYIFTTHGTIVDGVPTSFNFPVLAISGSQFELAPVNGSTSWASGCYDNNGDSEQFIEVIGTSPVTLQIIRLNYESADVSCTGENEPVSFTTTYDLTLDGTTEDIAGWVTDVIIAADDGPGSVAAPQKQDASGALSDTESHTNMTATVTNTDVESISIGDVLPFAYIVDDSTSVAVLYNIDAGNHGEVIAPLILQLP